MTAFVDSNVLLYAFSADPRRVRARQILAEGGMISVQSLNEFAHVARRKLGFDWPDVIAGLKSLRTFFPTIVPLTLETHDRGVAIAGRYQLSIYDGMIVAAALIAGCDTLYSEDMHAGLVVEDRLTIVNPFA